MAYELESSYRRIFDKSQSPVFLEMLAARHGADRQPFEEREDATKRIYLDFGCAQGHSILALAPLYPFIEFIGIDFNRTHVEEANDEVARLRLENTRFYHADFLSLPSELPKADYLVARGIYSWLSLDVKQALQKAFARLSKPNALLKLHYTVRPGALFRESVMTAINLATGSARSADKGRNFLSQMIEEAPAFTEYFAAGHQGLKAMLSETEEAWRHDILNADYQAEYAHKVIKTIEDHGFHYIASAHYLKNFPEVLVSEKFLATLKTLPTADGQTLLDHLTANGARDDVFIHQPFTRGQKLYNHELRFGLVVSNQKVAEPMQTVRGQVIFTRDDCQRILATLKNVPMTFAEIQSSLPDIAGHTLAFWLDMLISGGRIGPFLPAKQAEMVDRARLRRINQERIEQSMMHFNEKTSTPLLAANYGNCLVAGWFETLILQNFSNRHQIGTQKQMLARMHRASIGFSGSDGRPAPDQLKAFQAELRKLEENYFSKMEYWGIDV